MATLRRWSITLVTAVATAAVLLVAGAVLAGGGAGTAPRPVPRAPQRAADVGPEGVPLTRGARLGPARSPRPGSSSGGVLCGSGEQLTYHVHARLTLLVHGKPRSVPLGVGIGRPLRITKTARGGFVSGGSCFSFLHTHAADGIIHIEAPVRVTFTLGQFFDVWQQRLDRRHLGPVTGRVVAYVNGRRYRGDPRSIPLRRHAQILLVVGGMRTPPPLIEFPPGL
jgi:hypothetical protein